MGSLFFFLMVFLMGSLFFFLMDFDIMVFKGFFIFENQVILAASITHSPTIFILQCPPVSSFQKINNKWKSILQWEKERMLNSNQSW
uniref:Uncharacterized protein n=1 Tax=Cucumis sativus TaxID=3659 RepID=A0A0A0M3T1_CUCSA